MKFTIFTPFYNYLDALEVLYEAIKNQTYTNWEWIVCDDFSDSDEVIDRLKQISDSDKRVRIIYPKWKKQYFYNLPIEHCSGEIIVKQDSDDIPSVKLLEVYNHVYRKFPNLSFLGTSSLMVTFDAVDSPFSSGQVTGAKYINYKNSSNYLECEKNGVMYSIGDARSYRISGLINNGIFLTESDPKFISGEDYVKTLTVEEYGSFFALPRILHKYSNRHSSNSGGYFNKIYSDIEKENFLKYYIDLAKNRVDRKTLVSIEDYYDGSFHHFKNFYFSGIENEIEREKIEYWSDSLMARDIQKINDLYFDHDLSFNESIDSPKFIIIDANGTNIILDVLSNRNLQECTITITSDKKNHDTSINMVKSLGYHYWFNIHYYSTIRISV